MIVVWWSPIRRSSWVVIGRLLPLVLRWQKDGRVRLAGWKGLAHVVAAALRAASDEPVDKACSIIPTNEINRGIGTARFRSVDMRIAGGSRSRSRDVADGIGAGLGIKQPVRVAYGGHGVEKRHIVLHGHFMFGHGEDVVHCADR